MLGRMPSTLSNMARDWYWGGGMATLSLDCTGTLGAIAVGTGVAAGAAVGGTITRVGPVGVGMAVGGGAGLAVGAGVAGIAVGVAGMAVGAGVAGITVGGRGWLRSRRGGRRRGRGLVRSVIAASDDYGGRQNDHRQQQEDFRGWEDSH